MRASGHTICGPTTITRQLRDVNEPPCSTARTNSNTPSVPRAMTSAGGAGSSPQLSLATHALQSQHSKDKKFRFRQPRMRDEDVGKANGPRAWRPCKNQSAKQMCQQS